MVTFLGIVWWAFSSKRKAAFDEAARVPFEDEPQIDNNKNFFGVDSWPILIAVSGNWYITIISIISILACYWLIRWMSADYKKSGGEEKYRARLGR